MPKHDRSGRNISKATQLKYAREKDCSNTKKKSIKERRMKRHVFRLQRAKAKYALAMTYNCSYPFDTIYVCTC